ncbi:Clavaminate synthase-like protein [Meredithblackwellia eburnea MCA 4105]
MVAVKVPLVAPTVDSVTSLKAELGKSSLPFVPFDIPGARTFNGHTFPLGLKLLEDTPTPSVDAGAEYLQKLAASGALTKLLNQHGAVLFRGFGHPSPETFSVLVRAAEEARGSKPFEQIGLAGKRNNLAKEVFTANEGPKERRFYQHNEYARYTHFPSNIHFYAEKAAIKGGATPLANSLEVFERVFAELPEFVEELQQRGLSMRQVYRAPGNTGKGNEFTWDGPDSFGHEILPGDSDEVRREKAEKQARRLTDDFRWLDDGSLEIIQHVPAVRRFKEGGWPTWFNGLSGRHGTTRDQGALDFPHIGRDGMTYLPSVYDDGTQIPRRYLDRLLEVIAELEVELEWQDGDLIFVNNYRTSHGRCPWEEGERKILVSMWETGEGLAAY